MSLIFLISFISVISTSAASLRQQTAVRCTKGELSYVCKGRGHFQGDSISTRDSRLGTSRHPGVCVCTTGGYTPQRPQHCCNSLEASCDACKQGVSVRRFCRTNPHYSYRGCERYNKPQRPQCCNSLEASCDACKQGVSVRRFCRANPHYSYHGCERYNKPQRPQCCNSLEASCDACKQGLSVRRFCRANPHYSYRGCERYIRPKRQWIPHRACLPSVTYRGRQIRGCAPPDSFTPDKTKWWCATNRPNLLGFLGNNWQYCTYG